MASYAAAGAAAVAALLAARELLVRNALDARLGDEHAIRQWIGRLDGSKIVSAQTREVELPSYLGQVSWRGTSVAGTLRWPRSAWQAHFTVFPGLVSPGEALAIKDVLAEAAEDFDEDRDGVDEMITYEFIIMSAGAMKARDPVRAELRQRLLAITEPIIRTRIEPLVRGRYPAARNVCHSMIRRYLHNERRTHGTHWDVPSFVSVVVSLDSTGREFEGGFYVTTGTGERSFIPLQRGDTVVHQGDLLHGVHVRSGDRWSWAMWFQDSDACDSHPSDWWSGEDDAVALTLRAMRARNAEQAMNWVQRAAESGFPRALTYLGRSYQEAWHNQTRDLHQAAYWYQQARTAGDAGAAYYLGTVERARANLTAALACFADGAGRGDPAAMEQLAVMYQGAEGVPRDLNTALHWFSEAADFSAEAAYQAYLLASESTDGRNRSSAEDAPLFLERAARMGHFKAMKAIVEPLLRGERWEEAAPWLLRLDSGPPLAKFVELYRRGVAMKPFTVFRGGQLLQSIADKGDPTAVSLLATYEAAWHSRQR